MLPANSHTAAFSKAIAIGLILLAGLAMLSMSVRSASAGGRPLAAELSGINEVPGSGDPDGNGTARLWLNQGQAEVCYRLEVADVILPATGAHIHAAPVGVAGPIVVPLTPPNASGVSSGCVNADKELVKAIRQHSENYYVNVHTSDFPAGAVRGQLSK